MIIAVHPKMLKQLSSATPVWLRHYVIADAILLSGYVNGVHVNLGRGLPNPAVNFGVLPMIFAINGNADQQRVMVKG